MPSLVGAEGRHRMSVHRPQQIHCLEVVDTRGPPAGAEGLVVAPIELQHAIYVLKPYLWHDWL